MRIGIYNPYFDGFGGGERYTLTLASHWSKTHEVFLFWDDDSIRKIAEERFDIDLSRIKTVHNFFRSKNLLKKALFSKQYDLIFFLSDGTIPTSFAKYNILHFQVPFARVQIQPFKLRQYHAVICNSQFTKNNLDPKLGKQAIVIYPPVDTSQFYAGKKENIVLSVGRFSSYFQTKKQEVLIEAWKKAKIKDWKLFLAGGLMSSDQAYLAKLKKLASGLSIHFLPNISFVDLGILYSKAPIYWHAAGFGEKDPKLMEHFGITTVEAMSAGCIPLVYNGGGLPEIIKDRKNGFLWNTIDELIDKTVTLLFQKEVTQQVRRAAQERAKTFDEQRFCDAFDHLLHNLV